MDEFDIVRKAGLRPVDLHRLLKITRVTASLWLNGHVQPHALLRNRVNTLLDAVAKAYEAGDLPVPVNIKRADRAKYVNSCIARQLTPKG